MSYQPGQIVVRRFELMQKLGAGGMGVVFGALDRELDEEVALKFLPEAMAGDPEAVAQFAKEVKRARKVPGKYVLRVYDLWDDGEGGRFVTMEWAKGGDLTAYRRKYGTLSWDQAKTILLPILKGLQAVHEAGIVHRDIKPANILFREDGTPVVADFGISKSIQASMSRISQDATISGTPAYMAPEAIRGGSEIGFHTDLYAIGCMAYELLTGHTPFVGDPMSVMYNQTHEEPTFTGLPPEAIRWIGACMVKDPSRRVQSAEELIIGLGDPNQLSKRGLEGHAIDALTLPDSKAGPSASPRTLPRVGPFEDERTHKVKPSEQTTTSPGAATPGSLVSESPIASNLGSAGGAGSGWRWRYEKGPGGMAVRVAELGRSGSVGHAVDTKAWHELPSRSDGVSEAKYVRGPGGMAVRLDENRETRRTGIIRTPRTNTSIWVLTGVLVVLLATLAGLLLGE